MLRRLILQGLARRIVTERLLQHEGCASAQCRASSAVPEPVDSPRMEVDTTRKWYTDPNITTRAAVKIVKERLEQRGPQRVSHLMELARRIQSPEEAAMVIEVAQTFALHRARRQQHDGISPTLSAYLLKKVLEAGDVKQALEVLRRSPELQLTFQRPGFTRVIIRASQQGDLRAVVSALELLRAARLRPNRDIAHHVLRGCFENGRPDLAVAFCREFEANGVPPRPAMKEKVDAAAVDLEAATPGKRAAPGKAAAVQGEAGLGDECPEESQSADTLT